jgi:hypothetical protein
MNHAEKRSCNDFCSDFLALSGGERPRAGDYYYHQELEAGGAECSVHQILNGECVVIPMDKSVAAWKTKNDCRGRTIIAECN